MAPCCTPTARSAASVLFTHQGATARRMMLNLSDTHLSVVDIEDLNAPPLSRSSRWPPT